MEVWYASYGSNLLEERFLAYIYGRTATGSEQPEAGCKEKKPPKSSELIDINYPLYFAKERSKWGAGGVAFIGTERSTLETTIGRMYLISEGQFIDVVAQENNRHAISLELESIIANGYADLGLGWYDRIVYLGDKNGAPIFTFTSSTPLSRVQFTMPSAAYLSTIAKGLMESGLSLEEIIEYFHDKNGISGNLNEKELQKYIEG
ncbi:hypothetical protein [Ornithinibacillus xuwenensis]|uniref:Histone deacetylase n=1 Tax=Ornithinibacillus xuwenensis TaxID=3144668 RepID=A0ABU9XJU2_9BACI